MDHNISHRVTQGLRLREIDVLTAFEDGCNDVSDQELLQRATLLKRVLFSMDDDLLAEAAYCQKLNIDFYGIIYAHQLRINIKTCIEQIELIAKIGEPEDVFNRVLFLPF